MILRKQNEFVVFDIGERYIKAVFVRTNWDGTLEYIYSSKIASKGIANENISNLRSLSDALFQLIYRIEIDVGTSIKSVVIIFSCMSVSCKNFKTFINTEGIIRESHVQNINYRLNLGLDKAILGYLQKSYIVDNVQNIENPISMCGSKLGIDTLFLTIDNVVIRNLISIFNRNEIVVNYIGFGDLIASSFFSDENFTVIDIGYSSSRVVVQSKQSNLKDIFILPIGFKNLIQNIAKNNIQNTEECEKKIEVVFDNSNKVFVDITRQFFKNLFQIIIKKISEYDYFSKGTYKNYLIGGITLIPLIDYYLSQVFDKDFCIYEMNQKFLSIYNRNIFLNCIATANYLFKNKDNQVYLLRIEE